MQPHFAAGIDPNSAQYDRLSTNTAFEVPFFYRNRLFHQAFKTIHGPRLYARAVEDTIFPIYLKKAWTLSVSL